MSRRAAGGLRVLVPVAAGTAIYAFGLHYFVLPNTLMEGGVTGVGLLLYYIFGLPLSFTTLLLNVPLFLAGWRLLGWKSMTMTLYGTLCLTCSLWLMERAVDARLIVPLASGRDLILAALYAGVTLGAGLGIVFRFGATTGGMDIAARILVRKYGWSMGRTILGIDAAIIGSSLFFVPVERVLYTLVVVFIAARVIDFVQEGAYVGKAFTIVTDKGQAIADAVTRKLDRSVTILQATGGYSGASKQVVYCIVGRSEARALREIVHEIDPKAFFAISDAHDVVGEGFRER
ncbi:hypothetical protein Theco_1826 [Thermobacillus composti KWC4]|uniref:DUF2179 domain-containing protein n=1 Tax=Thermobacillus composti (strain DSM 18247 / JCM 13945 / KWC4) TaxID=717605 RepID=L0EDS6_THECK|nr:YitT family protein [Thermobacillus composti]AGA57957.1 hypothetical protein Theco_1826 [Thermobacillus composti KWC4]